MAVTAYTYATTDNRFKITDLSLANKPHPVLAATILGMKPGDSYTPEGFSGYSVILLSTCNTLTGSPFTALDFAFGGAGWSVWGGVPDTAAASSDGVQDAHATFTYTYRKV